MKMAMKSSLDENDPKEDECSTYAMQQEIKVVVSCKPSDRKVENDMGMTRILTYAAACSNLWFVMINVWLLGH